MQQRSCCQRCLASDQQPPIRLHSLPSTFIGLRIYSGVHLSGHVEADGAAVFRPACALGAEGIISKRKETALARSQARGGRGLWSIRPAGYDGTELAMDTFAKSWGRPLPPRWVQGSRFRQSGALTLDRGAFTGTHRPSAALPMRRTDGAPPPQLSGCRGPASTIPLLGPTHLEGDGLVASRALAAGVSERPD
jgi:hypothetical protein